MTLTYDQTLLQDKNIQNCLAQLDHYVYAFVDETVTPEKIFYVGKGVGRRCLDHLNGSGTNQELNQKITKCIGESKLRIDILRHGLTDAQAKAIESTCIDLLNVNQLSNKVRGKGTSVGRISLEEALSLTETIPEVSVRSEHKGIAFLLNQTYKSSMSAIELWEITRGVWHNPPRSKDIKFAYATYAGIVKEVYQISTWLPAGTQQYFTRDHNSLATKTKRWEFAGHIAPDPIRELYVGGIIQRPRSFSQPFVIVGSEK